MTLASFDGCWSGNVKPKTPPCDLMLHVRCGRRHTAGVLHNKLGGSSTVSLTCAFMKIQTVTTRFSKKGQTVMDGETVEEKVRVERNEVMLGGRKKRGGGGGGGGHWGVYPSGGSCRVACTALILGEGTWSWVPTSVYSPVWGK